MIILKSCKFDLVLYKFTSKREHLCWYLRNIYVNFCQIVCLQYSIIYPQCKTADELKNKNQAEEMTNWDDDYEDDYYGEIETDVQYEVSTYCSYIKNMHKLSVR